MDIIFEFKINFSILLAFLSFLLSIYTIYRTRKHITVTWSDIQKIPVENLYIGDQNNIYFTENLYYIRLDIVNSSPSDISYFDLRAFDPNLNISYNILNKNILPADLKSAPITQSILNYPSFMNVPEKLYGVLKANSFTSLDLFIFDSSVCKINESQMIVSFKIPDRKFLSQDNYAITNRKNFKTYTVNMSLKKQKY